MPELVLCNCTICTMAGFVHLIVQADQFELTAGEGDLHAYTFNTRTARHLFCRHCGIKAFYRPRSHPTGYSVNVRCLDSDSRDALADAPLRDFNGQSWEASIDDLRGRTSQ